MTDLTALFAELRFIAVAADAASAVTADAHSAENATRLESSGETGNPARLFADPLKLAAECGAIKARSRARTERAMSAGKNP